MPRHSRPSPTARRGNYEPVSVTGTASQPRLEKPQFFILDGVKVVDVGYHACQGATSRMSDALPDAHAATANPPLAFQQK